MQSVTVSPGLQVKLLSMREGKPPTFSLCHQFLIVMATSLVAIIFRSRASHGSGRTYMCAYALYMHRTRRRGVHVHVVQACGPGANKRVREFSAN